MSDTLLYLAICQTKQIGQNRNWQSGIGQKNYNCCTPKKKSSGKEIKTSFMFLLRTDDLGDEWLREPRETEDTLLRSRLQPLGKATPGSGDWGADGTGGLSSSRRVDVKSGCVDGDKRDGRAGDRCCWTAHIWKHTIKVREHYDKLSIWGDIAAHVCCGLYTKNDEGSRKQMKCNSNIISLESERIFQSCYFTVHYILRNHCTIFFLTRQTTRSPLNDLVSVLAKWSHVTLWSVYNCGFGCYNNES